MAESTNPGRRDSGGKNHRGGRHEAARSHAQRKRQGGRAPRSSGHTPWERQADGSTPAQGKRQAGRAPRSAGHTPWERQAGGPGRPSGSPPWERQPGGSLPVRGKHAATAPGVTSPGASALSPAATSPEAGPQDAAGPAGSRSSVLAVSRRKLLIAGGGLAAAFAGLDALRHLAVTPIRLDASEGKLHHANVRADPGLPDVQFDISRFVAPAQTVDGILVSFPPVYTLFAPARLASAPTKDDQDQLEAALDRVEQAYSFAPQGVFTFIAYGLPYFTRFPGALFTLVPRLLSDESRFALEEAVPSPTDVSPSNPGITKKTFNVPVQIEANDLLVTLRSDRVDNLWDVMAFLGGSNMLAGERVPSPTLSCGLTFTSARVMFAQQGLPRSVAETNSLPFAQFVNPASPMWMGFADQQVNASAPAPDVTFAGADGIHLTTAEPGDYFDNGSLQHLSHDILDMAQFFDLNAAGTPGSDGTFLERVQYMFRADPPQSKGFADQFANGGGVAFLNNTFQGFDDARRSAQGIGTLPDPTTGKPQHRMGHLSCLQRSSRAADGRPIHLRMDGPGFDSMDVPDGSKQPKLEFTVFVPTADFFTTMRVNQASLDLQNEFGVEPTDNGLERFITATRRQNFLIPPRRHRAFPFAEFGPGNGSAARSSSASTGSGRGGSGGGSGGPGPGGSGHGAPGPGGSGHGGH